MAKTKPGPRAKGKTASSKRASRRQSKFGGSAAKPKPKPKPAKAKGGAAAATAPRGAKPKRKRERGADDDDDDDAADAAPPPKVARAEAQAKRKEEVGALLGVWEKLRRKETPKEAREALAADVIKAAKGSVAAMALSHKASRVLQAAVAHGGAEAWKAVAAEATPRLLELSLSSYGNFLARKLFEKAEKEELPSLFAAFKGHVTRLVRHPCGSAVLDVAYHIASPAQKAALVAEFYGKEFVLFGPGGALGTQQQQQKQQHGAGAMAELLAAHPEKKAGVVKNMAATLTPVLEKGIVSHSIVHRALREFLELAADSDQTITDASLSVAGPALLRMMHTRDGARAAAALLVGSAAKERKRVVKAMKGHAVKLARDDQAHAVVACLLDVVDDTTAVAKTLVPELREEVVDLASDLYGSRVLLNLLSPRNKRYLPPDTLEKLPGEEGAIPVTSTSKKSDEARRAELLGDVGGLGTTLCALCEDNAAAMLCKPHAADVLYEVSAGGAGNALAKAAGADALGRVHAAVADAATATVPSGDGEGDGGTERVIESFYGSRHLRRIALGVPEVAKLLWEGALKGKCKTLVSGHAAKVLSAVVSCSDKATAAAARKELKPLVKDVDAWVAQFAAAAAKSTPAPEPVKEATKARKAKRGA